MKIDYDFIEKIFNRKLELTKSSDKILLSQYNEHIPMYDIYSDMIYPISSMKLYYRLVECHYRFITDEVKQWIVNKMEKTQVVDTKKRYNDIIKILDNYDLNILEKTSYETLYKYAPAFGLSISICKRNSFHPYSSHLDPYYTKNELIKLGMNNHIIKKLEPKNLIDKQLHYDICKKVSKNDISHETIREHINSIIKNKAIGWIVFYSMTGSYIFNKILRHDKIMYNYMYDGLLKITNTINSVDLPKEYYFYRFMWDDHFLTSMKIGDIFIDNGFISSTRDPFYSPGIKMDFGLILVRINIPEHMKGVGLLIENFSLFPREEEFLIQTGAKLKLKAKDDKAVYHHTNEKFEKIIKKKYEFDLIGTLNELETLNLIDDMMIPSLDLHNIILTGRDRINLFESFLTKCDVYGHFRIKNRIFIAQWFDSYGAYSHMYRNKTKDGFIITEILNGSPILSIEMGDRMYVNYIKTKCPHDEYIENDIDDLNKTISFIGKLFYYSDAMIYFEYKNFTSFQSNYIDNKEYLYTRMYCNTIYDYYKFNKKHSDKQYKFNYGYWKLDKYGNMAVDIITANKLPKDIKQDLTWKELYIIIVEKYFYLYPRLEEWMNFNCERLFEQHYYDFNIILYLKNNGYNVHDIPRINHMTTFNRGDIFNTIYNSNIRRY